MAWDDKRAAVRWSHGAPQATSKLDGVRVSPQEVKDAKLRRIAEKEESKRRKALDIANRRQISELEISGIF